MSDHHPKRRHSSTEMTAVIPRVELAPLSERKTDPTAETQVPCPWCAPHGGQGYVPLEQRAKWMESYAELHAADEESVVPATDDGQR